MEQFLGFAIPGVPYGCTYAIVAVALVLTYRATGVFNFAFAAQAYVASLLFTALIQSAHLPVWLAFVIAVVVVSPLLGLAFDRLLFSRIPNSNNMAKLVTSISLLVGIPALMQVFIPQNYYAPPSIVFDPNTVYFTLAGAPFNGLDMSAVVFTSLVLLAMGIMMRFTPLGLQMRGAVESRRLVQLDGVNAGGVVAVAWVISSFLAGLAGVLLAPNFSQVQAQPFLTLDGGGDRRRRLCRVPLHDHRRPGRRGDRDRHLHAAGVPPDPELPLHLDPAQPAVPRAGGGAALPSGDARTSKRARTRWPPSTRRCRRWPRPSGLPRWAASSGCCGTSCWGSSSCPCSPGCPGTGRASSTRASPSRRCSSPSP